MGTLWRLSRSSEVTFPGMVTRRRTQPPPTRVGDSVRAPLRRRHPAFGHLAGDARLACARTARAWRRLAFLGPATLLLLLLVAPVTATTPAASPVATPAPGLVTLPNGRQLYLECRGTGSPTVILEAGYRSPATVWSDDLLQPDDPREMVFAGVAKFTRVCLYERPGVAAVIDGELVPSRSATVPMPRTVEDIVNDLHLLLATAEIPGPYILVGHSLGGLMVRLYAATYPDEVAGMVLVDPFAGELQDHLSPAEWDAFLRVNAEFPTEMAAYPAYETIDFASASASLAAAPPLPPLPLVVIARGRPLGVPEAALGFDPATLEAAWRAAVTDVAALSPLGRLTIAAESEHYVQLDEPEIVINAIGRVVTALREPGAYQPPADPAATPTS